MRRFAFTITILGLFSLLILQNLPPKIISSQNELEIFQPNQKFQIGGIVIEETYVNNYKILHLDNNIKLQCELSCPSFLNRHIQALVTLEKFNNKNYLKILKVEILKE